MRKWLVDVNRAQPRDRELQVQVLRKVTHCARFDRIESSVPQLRRVRITGINSYHPPLGASTYLSRQYITAEAMEWKLGPGIDGTYNSGFCSGKSMTNHTNHQLHRWCRYDPCLVAYLYFDMCRVNTQ